MKLFKKQEKEVKVDENGNPINDDKKIDVKNIGKKILIGLGVVAAGVVAFIAVGVAMAADSDESIMSIDSEASDCSEESKTSEETDNNDSVTSEE